MKTMKKRLSSMKERLSLQRKNYFRYSAAGLCMLAAALLMCIAFPQKAQAAEQYRSCKRYEWASQTKVNVSGAQFWIDEKSLSAAPASGKKFTVYKTKSGEKLQDRIVSNGSYVYYAVEKKSDGLTTVYQTNLKTKAKKKVASCKLSYGQFAGFYNNNIYLLKPLAEYDIRAKFTAYNTKTKKYKTVKKMVVLPRQYGRYFLYAGEGDSSAPRKFYSYDAYTGKTVTLSTRCSNVSAQNGKIYYLEYNSGNTKAALKVCSLTGTSKKTIANIEGWYGSFYVEFGPKYISLQNLYAKLPYKYTRITYSTGKMTKSSKAEYNKLQASEQ